MQHALVHLTFSVAIPSEPNGGNHTPQFTESARTVEAHKAMLETVKALSLTAFRALDDDAFFAKVKACPIQRVFAHHR